MAEPLTITTSNFETEVLQAATPVLIDFWAPWCGPCRLVAPAVEEMAAQYAGKLKVGKVNVDDHIEQAQRLRVMNIPTLIFFKDGQEVDRVVGVAPKEALVKKLNALLS
jgi:thioredoxin 1